MYSKLFFVTFSCILCSTWAQIRVNITDGEIEGQSTLINGKSVHNFIGIPFAEPPIHDLRFKRSVRLKSKWDNVLKATEIKPQCISPFNTSALISEDCLHLNIWTPTLNASANLPVMFWIYGGSFFMGSATKQVDGYNIFDGTQLALKDVVVVTANYRLGIFGFLYGGSDEAPGNMGYWDQVLALEWLRDNVKQFGGNPEDITLFGVSAGSISISAHILSPVSRNLFSKGIMQSGSVFLTSSPISSGRESALKSAESFAKDQRLFTYACPDNKEWMQCLKSKTTEELNTAQKMSFYITHGSTPFNPLNGDPFMPKTFAQSLKDSDFKTDIRLMIGHSAMEGVSFANDFDQMNHLSGRYNPRVLTEVTKAQVYEDIKLFIPESSFGKQLVEYIAKAYTEGALDSRGLIRSAAHAYGDVAITCPTIIFGEELVKHPAFKGTVYQYRLDYVNSKSISYNSLWAEAEHTDEQPLVFGRPLNEKKNNWTKDDQRISEEMMNIWTHFAKNGDPNPADDIWPQYSVGKTDGKVNASFLSINKSKNTIHFNSYRGNDGFGPQVINNCLNFWYKLFTNTSDLNSLSNKCHQNSYLIIYLIIISLFAKYFLI